MSDFDPVAEAQRVMRNYINDHDEEYVGDVGWLIDYIEALVAALRLAEVSVQHEYDNCEHSQLRADYEVELHTIRHLLPTLERTNG